MVHYLSFQMSVDYSPRALRDTPHVPSVTLLRYPAVNTLKLQQPPPPPPPRPQLQLKVKMREFVFTCLS